MPPVHEAQCMVTFNIDDVVTTNQGFYHALYHWIATCCMQSFSKAFLNVIISGTEYSLFTLQEIRGHKLGLYCKDTLCYTIGKSSAVVKNASGEYEEAFSTQLAPYVAAKKQLHIKPKYQHMQQILSETDLQPLTSYVKMLHIAYMPKEKARHFIKQMTKACDILTSVLQHRIRIPSLQLLAGKKGENGFFDEATETIGIYYKYDRDLLMQLALFHEYGHLIDKRRQQNPLYKKKRQQIYEMLLEMPTLKAIEHDRSLTDEHRHYLRSIDEVMARLFESTVYYEHFGICSNKAFLFNEQEIKEVGIKSIF